ncbi:YfiR family protein [Ideonella sp. BN130291]|uniref:YfiR family protein n=1 Tax=Ideonella sp. BN130291 TaxID=3112940 RepID=UPI002E25E033|nr:YfiR family protein [Ideonella sp. BN130291]
MRLLSVPRCLALLCAALACACAQAVERVELEAAIVYNILLFVEWPADAGLIAGGPLVLCVDALSPLSAPLKSLAGRPVRSHRLEPRDLPANDARGCHAVVLDAAAAKGAPARRALKGLPLLVIAGEAVDDDSAAIRLAHAAGRIAFDVDLGVARQSRLQISSRLLRLARKVSE